MPQGNYLAAFRGPDLAEIDRSAYSNSLMRNDVARIPQANRMQDQAIQSADIQIGDAQKKNAAGILGRNFSIAANSPRPREAMRAFLASPDFVAAGKLVGLPVEQFTVTDQDDDNSIRQQAMAWAQALGASGQQGIGVQSTQILEDGTIATVMDDGRLVRTNERAREPYHAPEPLEPTVGPDGKPVLTPRGQAAGAQPYQRPTGGLSPRDATTARNKLTQLDIAAKQLADVQRAYEALAGGGTGPLAGRVPTQLGEAFDAAVNSMRDTITSVTRTPGVGAMSDFETRLNQAKMPDRKLWHHGNIQQQIDSIQQIIQGLAQGYGGLLEDNAAPTPNSQGLPDFSTMSDEQLLQIINGQ